MPQTTEHALVRRFVPAELDPAQLDQLEPLYQQLLERDLPDATALEAWLTDYAELSSVVGEFAARRNIEHACHTEDEDVFKAFMHWVETLAPALKPYGFKLAKKYLDAAGRSELEARDERFRMIGRSWEAEAEIYRDANIPLQTRITKLNTDYDQRIGAMQVEYRGETFTLQQLGRFLEETDRTVRQETWELSTNRRLEDREAIDTVYSDMIKLRQEVAQNADLPDYRAYVWKSMERFDYTPQHCQDFADAIEKVCVPRVAELDRQRRDALGLDALRPWDGSVDLQGREPLRPFDAKNVQTLVDGGVEVFRRVSPVLSEQFAEMQMGRNLDLDSRRGKRAGGFQSSLAESREPFIFMNAAGLQRDVDTLLHEGGHAFHYQWASRNEPLYFLHHAPIEFCEVASMSMELLGCEHYDVFYDDPELGPAQAARAKRKQLEGIVRILPWIATIDRFQHWVYEHPQHTVEQRTDAWRDIFGRFGSSEVDWTGYEAGFDARWQAQLHLFHHPFYYVEYGIAQLGALQLWQNYQRDPEQTLKQYRDALSLGATKPLPDLFQAAGIKFDFSESTLAPLIDAVADELAKLPD